MLLWPSISVNWDDHIDRLGGKDAGYVHLCRILAFRHNMHGMVIRRFFVAFICPRLEYCSAVWCGCITCLAEASRKSSASSGKSNRQESNFAGHVDASTGSSPHFVVAKARTLPWPSLAALYSERSSCPTASLVPCAQLRSLAFLTPFVFLLLHPLVTCRPFSFKLYPSGTGCLLLLPLLRLSLLFGQRSAATCILSRVCSAVVSFSSSLSFFL